MTNSSITIKAGISSERRRMDRKSRPIPFLVLAIINIGCEGSNISDSRDNSKNNDNASCGNGVVESTETCDFSGELPCGDLGFNVNATYRCVQCRLDLSACGSPSDVGNDTDTLVTELTPECGNLAVETGEQCDFLGIKPCSDYGYNQGNYSCIGCKIDLSQCSVIPTICDPGTSTSCSCPNGILGYQTCNSEGTAYGGCFCDTNMAPACEPLRAVADCPSINSCNAVLAMTGMTIYESSSEETALRNNLESWMCDVDNGESVYEYAKSHSTDASTGFWVFSADVSHSYEEDQYEFESWQREHCEEYVENLSVDEVRNHLQNIVDNRPNIGAWTECVNTVTAAQISCYTSQENLSGLIMAPTLFPGENGVFQLSIGWCGSSGDISETGAFITSGLTITGAECQIPESLTEGQFIGIGIQEISCRRIDNEEILATLAVSTQVAQKTYSATAYLEASCIPGEKQCFNGASRVCDESQKWLFDRQCAGECIVATGTCSDVCDPGETRCNENSVMLCDENAEWIENEECSYLCSDGRCTGDCTPETRRCFENNIQTCTLDGQWENSETCDLGCEGGNSPACKVPAIIDHLVEYSLNAIGDWPRTGGDCDMDCDGGDCVPVIGRLAVEPSGNNVVLSVYFYTKENGGDGTTFDGTKYITISTPGHVVGISGSTSCESSETSCGERHDWYTFSSQCSLATDLQYRVDSSGDDCDIVGLKGTVRFTARIQE